MNHILPRFQKLADRDRQQAAILRRAIGEAVADDRPTTMPSNRIVKAEPGDLRGIPALAFGVGGVIRGTQPEAEVMRRMSPDRLAT